MSKRKAVSIVLTRNPESPEVYLVERNPALKFFGGYFAFPGGTLDEEDHSAQIANAAVAQPDSLPFMAAAARELFEETGVLLARGDNMIEAGKRRHYRQQLLAGEIDFHEMLGRESLAIDARDFHFMGAVLTPEFAPVRYDTQFYWVQVPEGQMPEIVHGELVSGNYCHADAALVRWKRGEMIIVPPVIFMLREFAGHSVAAGTPAILKHTEDYSAGAIHQIYFTPGVQMVPLATGTLLPATHTNAYLVGESQLYLIDPAPSDPNEQQRFWNYLDNRLAEGCEFKAILLTHHHADHVGALQACVERYGLPILAHRNTAEKLGIMPTRYLEHGDELDLGESPDGQPDWQLKVYHTPGHASGHLAFQETRYGSVIAGDMISTLSTIVINPPDGHLATYMESLRLLESVTTGTIYPSHGPAVRTGREVLRYFIKHRQEREQKLLATLTAEPQSTYELVRRVYNDVDPAIWSLAELSLQAGLIKLREEGKCAERGGGFVKRS